MKDEVLGVISAVLIGVIVALLNKWTGIDGQDKNTTTSVIKQAIIDMQTIQNATIDGTAIKTLATGLKETLENITKDAAKANQAAVEEALNASKVARVTYATEVAQEIKTKDEEDKSPLIKKTLPRTPTTTVQELITTAAAQSKYSVKVYETFYQNKAASKDKTFGSFTEMKKWWDKSVYVTKGYQCAFLDTTHDLTDDVYATAVSYNVEMRAAGTLETTKAHKDAKMPQYRVAMFSLDTKRRLESVGSSLKNNRAIIWTLNGEPTPEAASDYFVEYLRDNQNEHLYASGSQKGFISYFWPDRGNYRVYEKA